MMNLDELTEAIRNVSSERVVQALANLLIEWKSNDETAEELKHTLERYFGHTWIKRNEDHKNLYNMWSEFKDEIILGIEGMTMNERLYWFGLFQRFDACPNQEAKLVIYRKLHANP